MERKVDRTRAIEVLQPDISNQPNVAKWAVIQQYYENIQWSQLDVGADSGSKVVYKSSKSAEECTVENHQRERK